jgi:pteridine reductase
MNKTALVTGASKRIGKSIAEFLAGKGWNIIIHYNFSEKDAEYQVSELSEKYPGQTFGFIKGDLSDKEELVKFLLDHQQIILMFVKYG